MGQMAFGCSIIVRIVCKIISEMHVIRDFVFLCRKIGSIKGHFCRYIINMPTKYLKLANKVSSLKFKEQRFLHMTHSLVLLYMPTKYYHNISKGYKVMNEQAFVYRWTDRIQAYLYIPKSS